MNITPKYILKGRNSDGSTSTVSAWDFDTLAGLELANFFLLLFIGFAIAPFIAPLLAIITLFTYRGSEIVRGLAIMFFSAYFIYDCMNGWFAVIVAWCFFDEAGINILIGLNAAAFIIGAYFLLFGGLLYKWVTSPYEGITDDYYLTERDTLDFKVRVNYVFGILFGLLFAILVFFISQSYTTKHKGWLEYNVVTKDKIEDKKDMNEAIKRSNENYDKVHKPYGKNR